MTAVGQRQPVTLEGLRPGVSVIVAAGADRERPARPYRMVVSSAYPMDGGWVFASGTVRQLDGSPSARPYPYSTRAAHLLLSGLSYAERGEAVTAAG